MNDSYFDGNLLQLIGWSLLGFFVTVVTLGICYPWVVCRIYGWKIDHTVIEGRRLKFSGSAISLFGNWIKWLLLCIITLGIYSFWVRIALEKWKVKNTSFATSMHEELQRW
jgi:Predicted membrane protein